MSPKVAYYICVKYKTKYTIERVKDGPIWFLAFESLGYIGTLADPFLNPSQLVIYKYIKGEPKSELFNLFIIVEEPMNILEVFIIL